ncbi:uncharacterized protein AMSG_12333 [Thecamonas trahens ATCC 50062]|uniref:Uncharacterized protein n=1 Tax=Thecamonas trahens ATCC 50062 TaxID=461836 RepID=A0A0L0DRW1_THETB|nr:hypothetical protein AMSG_12333 [Thecamonas trahens ATCC 50062]KNC54982.1 hypothetical protein AMSG_12333 [Thecamonas trahens ATCC 50062]|eukprot:XP_013753456.1 hypothetical protein AMSG_12333 [Thecamonas trahens ATCC 50062]
MDAVLQKLEVRDQEVVQKALWRAGQYGERIKAACRNAVEGAVKSMASFVETYDEDIKRLTARNYASLNKTLAGIPHPDEATRTKLAFAQLRIDDESNIRTDMTANIAALGAALRSAASQLDNLPLPPPLPSRAREPDDRVRHMQARVEALVSERDVALAAHRSTVAELELERSRYDVLDNLYHSSLREAQAAVADLAAVVKPAATPAAPPPVPAEQPELEAQLDEFQAANAAAQLECLRLAQELDEARVRAQAAEAELAELSHFAHDASMLRDEAAALNDSLVIEREETNALASSLKIAFDVESESNQALRENLKTQVGITRTIKRKLAAAQTELAAVSQAKADALDRVHSLEAELAAMRDAAEHADSAKDAAVDAVRSDMATQLAELLEQLDEVQAENDALRTSIDALRPSALAADELPLLNDEITTLRAALDAATRDRDAVRADMNRMLAERDAARAELASVRASSHAQALVGSGHTAQALAERIVLYDELKAQYDASRKQWADHVRMLEEALESQKTSGAVAGLRRSLARDSELIQAALDRDTSQASILVAPSADPALKHQLTAMEAENQDLRSQLDQAILLNERLTSLSMLSSPRTPQGANPMALRELEDRLDEATQLNALLQARLDRGSPASQRSPLAPIENAPPADRSTNRLHTVIEELKNQANEAEALNAALSADAVAAHTAHQEVKAELETALADLASMRLRARENEASVLALQARVTELDTSLADITFNASREQAAGNAEVLAALATERDELAAERDAVRRELQAAESAAALADAHAQQLEARAKLRDDHMRSLQARLADDANMTEDLRSLADEAEALNAALTTEAELARREVDEARAERDEARAEAEKLRRTVTAHEARAKKLSSRVADLDESLSSHREALISERDTALAALAEAQLRVTAAEAEAEALLAQLRGQADEAEALNAALAAECTAARSSLAAAEADRDAALVELDVVRRAAADRAHRAAELDTRIDELDSSLSAVARAAREGSALPHTSGHHNGNALAEERATLVAERDAARAEADAARVEVESATARVAELEAQASLRDARTQELEAQALVALETSRARISELEALTLETNEFNAALSAEVSEARHAEAEAIYERDQALAQLEALHVTARARAEQAAKLDERLELLDTSINTQLMTGAELEAVIAERDGVATERDAAHVALRSARAEVNAAQARAAELDARAQAMESAHMASSARADEMQALADEAAALNAALAAEHNAAVTARAELEHEQAELTARVAALSSERSDLHARLEKAASEREALVAQLSGSQSPVQALKAAEAQIEKLEKQLIAPEQALADAHVLLAEQAQRLCTRDEELATAHMRVGELESLLAGANTRVTELQSALESSTRPERHNLDDNSLVVEMENTLTGAHARIAELLAERDGLTAALARHEARARELESKVANLDSSLHEVAENAEDKARSELADLKAERDAAVAELESVRAQLEREHALGEEKVRSATVEVETLRAELDEASTLNGALAVENARLATLEAERDSLAQENQALCERVGKLAALRDDSAADARSHKSEALEASAVAIARLEERLAAEQQSREVVERERASLIEAMAQTREAMATAMTSMEREREAHVQAHAAELREALAQMDALESANVSLSNEAERARLDASAIHERSDRESETRVEFLEAEVVRLLGEVASARSDAAAAAADTTPAADPTLDGATVEELQARLAHHQASAEQYQARVLSVLRGAEALVDGPINSIADVLRAMSALELERDMARDSLASLREHAASSDAELARTKAQAAVLGDKLEVALAENATLQHLVTRLQSALAEETARWSEAASRERFARASADSSWISRLDDMGEQLDASLAANSTLSHEEHMLRGQVDDLQAVVRGAHGSLDAHLETLQQMRALACEFVAPAEPGDVSQDIADQAREVEAGMAELEAALLEARHFSLSSSSVATLSDASLVSHESHIGVAASDDRATQLEVELAERNRLIADVVAEVRGTLGLRQVEVARVVRAAVELIDARAPDAGIRAEVVELRGMLEAESMRFETARARAVDAVFAGKEAELEETLAEVSAQLSARDAELAATVSSMRAQAARVTEAANVARALVDAGMPDEGLRTEVLRLSEALEVAQAEAIDALLVQDDADSSADSAISCSGSAVSDIAPPLPLEGLASDTPESDGARRDADRELDALCIELAAARGAEASARARLEAVCGMLRMHLDSLAAIAVAGGELVEAGAAGELLRDEVVRLADALEAARAQAVNEVFANGQDGDEARDELNAELALSRKREEVLENRLEAMGLELAESTAKVAALEASVDELVVEADELKRRETEAADAAGTMAHELDEAEASVAILQNELSVSRKREEVLETRLEETCLQLATLSDDTVVMRDSVVDTLRARLAVLAEAAAAADGLIVAGGEPVDALRDEVVRLADALEAARAQAVNEVFANGQDGDEARDELDAELALSRKREEVLENRLEAMGLELAESTAKVAALEANVDELVVKVDELEKQKAEMAKRLAALQDELGEAREHKRLLEARLTKSGVEQAALGKDLVGTLRARLTVVAEAANAAGDLVAAGIVDELLRGEVDRLTVALEAARAQAVNEVFAGEKPSDETDPELEAELLLLREREAELENKLEVADRELAESTAEVARLEAEIGEAKAREAAVTADLAATNAELVEARSALGSVVVVDDTTVSARLDDFNVSSDDDGDDNNELEPGESMLDVSELRETLGDACEDAEDRLVQIRRIMRVAGELVESWAMPNERLRNEIAELREELAVRAQREHLSLDEFNLSDEEPGFDVSDSSSVSSLECSIADTPVVRRAAVALAHASPQSPTVALPAAGSASELDVLRVQHARLSDLLAALMATEGSEAGAAAVAQMEELAAENARLRHDRGLLSDAEAGFRARDAGSEAELAKAAAKIRMLEDTLKEAKTEADAERTLMTRRGIAMAEKFESAQKLLRQYLESEQAGEASTTRLVEQLTEDKLALEGQLEDAKAKSRQAIGLERKLAEAQMELQVNARKYEARLVALEAKHLRVKSMLETVLEREDGTANNVLVANVESLLDEIAELRGQNDALSRSILNTPSGPPDAILMPMRSAMSSEASREHLRERYEVVSEEKARLEGEVTRLGEALSAHEAALCALAEEHKAAQAARGDVDTETMRLQEANSRLRDQLGRLNADLAEAHGAVDEAQAKANEALRQAAAAEADLAAEREAGELREERLAARLNALMEKFYVVQSALASYADDEESGAEKLSAQLVRLSSEKSQLEEELAAAEAQAQQGILLEQRLQEREREVEARDGRYEAKISALENRLSQLMSLVAQALEGEDAAGSIVERVGFLAEENEALRHENEQLLGVVRLQDMSGRTSSDHEALDRLAMDEQLSRARARIAIAESAKVEAEVRAEQARARALALEEAATGRFEDSGLADELERLQVMWRESEASKTELEVEVAKMEARIRASAADTAALSRVRTRLEVAEGELVESRQRRKNAEVRAAELEVMLERANDHITRLERAVGSGDDAAEADAASVSVLEAMLEAKEGALADAEAAHKQVVDALESALADQGRVLSRSNAARAELQVHVGELEARLAELSGAPKVVLTPEDSVEVRQEDVDVGKMTALKASLLEKEAIIKSLRAEAERQASTAAERIAFLENVGAAAEPCAVADNKEPDAIVVELEALLATKVEEVDAAVAKNGELEAKIKNLESRVEEQSMTVGEVESVLRDELTLEASLAEKTSAITTLEAEVKKMEAAVAAHEVMLEDERSASASKIEELETVVTGLEASLAERTSSIATLEAEAERMEAAVAAHEATLEDERSTSASKIEELETVVSGLEASLAEKTSSISALEATLEDERSISASKIEELETVVTGLEASLAEKTNSIGTLEASLEDERSASASKIEELETVVTGLEASLAERTSSIATLEAEAERMEAAVAAHEATPEDERSTSASKIEELETVVTGLEASLAEKTNSIATLEAKAERMEAAVAAHEASLEDERSASASKIEELETVVTGLEASLAEKTNSISALEASLEDERSASTSKIEELETVVTGLEASLAEKTNSIATLEAEAERMEAAVAAHEATLEDERSASASKIEELETVVSGLEASLAEKTNSIAILEAEAERMEAAVAAHEASLKDERSASASRIEELETVVSGLEASLAEKTNSIATLEAEAERMEAAVAAHEASLKDERSASASKIEELETVASGLEATLVMKTTSIETMSRTIQQVEHERDDTVAQAERLEAELRRAIAARDARDADLLALEDELTTVRNSLRDARSQAAAAQTACDDAVFEAESLTSRLEAEQARLAKTQDELAATTERADEADRILERSAAAMAEVDDLRTSNTALLAEIAQLSAEAEDRVAAAVACQTEHLEAERDSLASANAALQSQTESLRLDHEASLQVSSSTILELEDAKTELEAKLDAARGERDAALALQDELKEAQAGIEADLRKLAEEQATKVDELQTQLALAEETVMVHAAVLTARDRDLADARAQLEAAHADLEQMAVLGKELSAKAAAAQRAEAAAVQRAERAKAAAQDAQLQAEAITSSRSSLLADLHAAQASLEDSRTEVAKLRVEVQRFDAELATVRAQNASLTSELDAEMIHGAKLQEQVNAMHGLRTQSLNAEATAEDLRRTLEAETLAREAAQDDAVALRDRLAAATRELTQSRASCADAIRDRDALQARLDAALTLQSTVEARCTRLATEADAVPQLRKELRMLQRSVDAAQAENRELERAVEAQRERVQAERASAASAVSERTAALAEAERMRIELQTAEAALAAAQAAAADARAAADEVTVALVVRDGDHASAVTAVETQIAAARAEAQAALEAADAAEGRAAQSAARVAAVQAELAAKDSGLAELRASLTAARNELSATRVALSGAQAEAERDAAAAAASASQLEQTKVQLDEQMQLLEAADERAARAERAQGVARAEAESARAKAVSAASDAARLRDELDTARQAAAEARVEFELADAAREEAVTSADALVSRVQVLGTQLKEARVQLQAAYDEAAVAKSAAAEREQDLRNESQSEIRRLEAALERAQAAAVQAADTAAAQTQSDMQSQCSEADVDAVRERMKDQYESLLSQVKGAHKAAAARSAQRIADLEARLEDVERAADEARMAARAAQERGSGAPHSLRLSAAELEEIRQALAAALADTELSAEICVHVEALESSLVPLQRLLEQAGAGRETGELDADLVVASAAEGRGPSPAFVVEIDAEGDEPAALVRMLAAQMEAEAAFLAGESSRLAKAGMGVSDELVSTLHSLLAENAQLRAAVAAKTRALEDAAEVGGRAAETRIAQLLEERSALAVKLAEAQSAVQASDRATQGAVRKALVAQAEQAERERARALAKVDDAAMAHIARNAEAMALVQALAAGSQPGGLSRAARLVADEVAPAVDSREADAARKWSQAEARYSAHVGQLETELARLQAKLTGTAAPDVADLLSQLHLEQQARVHAQAEATAQQAAGARLKTDMLREISRLRVKLQQVQVRFLELENESQAETLALRERGGAGVYAVFAAGGKQYKVQVDDVVAMDALKGTSLGDAVAFDSVLAIGSPAETLVGTPYLPNTKVVAQVIEVTRSAKATVFKKKRRKGYTRTATHRAPITVLRIDSIVAL